MECFFQQAEDFTAVAGIAGGVVAAIVIAAVIAAAVAIYASKKGYDHYQAMSAMKASGATDNPLFSTNTNQREAGDVFDAL